MKLRADRRPLADTIKWASRQLPHNPVMPLHAALHLHAHTDGLTITTAGYDATIRHRLPADTITENTILAPGKLLADVLAAMTGDTIELAHDGNTLTVTAGRATFRLDTIPKGDYPTLNQPPTEAGTVDGTLFADAVARTAFAAATQDSPKYPWTTGIRLRADGNHLVLTASDTYRIADRRIPWNGNPDAIGGTGINVPAKVLADLAKQAACHTVHLHAAETAAIAGLATDTWQADIRLLADPFIDLEPLFDTPWTTVASFDVAEMTASVKRAAIAVPSDNPAVLLGFADDEVSVRAAGGAGAVAMDAIPGQLLDGGPMQIAVHPHYLLDALAAMGTSHATFHAFHPQHRALLLPSPDGGEEPGYRLLTMPIRLK